MSVIHNFLFGSGNPLFMRAQYENMMVRASLAAAIIKGRNNG